MVFGLEIVRSFRPKLAKSILLDVDLKIQIWPILDKITSKFLTQRNFA